MMMGIKGLDFEYEFEIPGKTPMLNEYIRWHWTKQRQHTKDLSWMVLKAVGMDKHRVPLKRCLLFIERRAHGHGKMDWDGLLGGCKGLIDALTERHPSGVGLIKDDNTDCIAAIPTVIPVSIPDDEPERTVVRIMKLE